MKVLNLSKNIKIKGFPQVFEPQHLPDIVISDNRTPEEYLKYVSQNFITAHLGKTDIPTVDYTFSSKEGIITFLENYSNMSIRQRLGEFYNRIFEVKDGEVVPYVVYYGYSAYTYEKLKTVLLHPLKPWVVIYGPVGSGKLALVKSILGEEYLDIFHISEKHKIGFRVESFKEEINDVVINTSLLSGDMELKEIVDFLYSRGYQATFIVEGKELPDILKTFPSFYVPALVERPIKERLLILEHMLRRICKESENIPSDINIEDDFLNAYFSYDWPKNLSELENSLRYSLAINGTKLSVESLPDYIKEVIFQV